jgi:hypothetical protein
MDWTLVALDSDPYHSVVARVMVRFFDRLSGD